MSIKYLNHINLQGNRIEGAAVEPLGSAPSNNLQIGRVYYDTSSGSAATYALRIYDGSGFVSVTGDITGVATTTSGQLTITNPDGPIPSFAILTGAISENGAKLATQAQIKTYVDAQVDTHDTLSELTDTTITSPADGAMLLYDSDTSKWIDNVMSGDATLIDTGALTLATVNSNVGSFGSATAIPAITVNAKGLITAVSTNSITTTLTIDDASSTQDVSLATDDLQFLGTANEITTAVTKDSTDVKVTIGLPNDVTIGNNLIVSGNLTVSGTTTQVDSNTVNIGDNIIVLNADEAGTPSQDGGIEIERGSSTNVLLTFKESTDRWQFTNDGTTYYSIPISTEYDKYDYWNLKVNGSSVDNISTTESLDFVNGNAITVSFASGEEIKIDHNDTSSQASVDNSGNAVIQDVTLDTYGHVTALVSKTIEVPADRMFAGAIGDGSAVSYNIDNSGASSPHINHGLGTDSSQFMVQLIEVSTGETVHADVSRKTGGRVQVVFATGNAPATNNIKVLINKIG